MNRIELVVARFAEDLAWLRKVPENFVIRVYNKGQPSAGSEPLPNVGAEAHTYLQHIVAHYAELADVTVFCQGRPFNHVPDFHRILRGLAIDRERLDGFRWLGFTVDWDDPTGSRLFQTWSKNPEGRALPMRKFWSALWPEPVPDRFVFFTGAHFAATAELIRTHPRSFYERARDVAASLPDAAHCFERCWDRVFGVDGIPPEYRKSELPLYLRPIRRLGLTWDKLRFPPPWMGNTGDRL